MTKNELDQETSPYLHQHKDNPVHWTTWSPKALDRARNEDKPILLSIGYAACHWCHVMAHESFEDQETANLMNANFINIKVDREERPDVDKVYMTALHALGEQGGWPLTMFLTPDAHPFWGGTYFPPEPRYGRPSFKHVLLELARIWRSERHKIDSNSTALLSALRQEPHSGARHPSPAQIQKSADIILNAVDARLGGLKGAPKFPQAPIFDFLWSVALHPSRPELANAVETTLTRISQGGIYDHLGGGIARYSVDADWLAPHFEKMLYDNAQFVSLLTRAWLKSANPLFRIRIEETIGFVLSEMITPQSLFASSFDADSEGHEGRFYVWSKSEIDAILDPAIGARFCEVYNVTIAGNWEASNILHRSQLPGLLSPEIESELTSARHKLRAERAKRTWPQRDHKVLADWNGLMIAALAEAAFVFNRADWASAAQHAMTALMAIHWHKDRLLHASTDGKARHEATADGYANLITAARALHTLTGSTGYLADANRLAQSLIQNHWDDTNGGLFFASARAVELPVRIRTIHDDATPNANAVMIANFAALHQFIGMAAHLKRSEQIAGTFAAEVQRNPFAAPTYLKNCGYLSDPIQLVATGDGPHDLLHEAIRHTGLDIIVHRIATKNDLADGHPAIAKLAAQDTPAIYICRGQICAAPIRNFSDLQAALQTLNLAG
jgi:uncharacterized protein